MVLFKGGNGTGGSPHKKGRLIGSKNRSDSASRRVNRVIPFGWIKEDGVSEGRGEPSGKTELITEKGNRKREKKRRDRRKGTEV